MQTTPKKQLAIASIPFQDWGHLYPDEKALGEGTIFKELNMPFYLAESCECSTGRGKNCGCRGSLSGIEQEREILMTKMYQTGFVLDDLTLYLDTHPQEPAALELYLQKSQERKQLKEEFAKKFYPLTRDCLADEQNLSCFTWQEGPMPWEGACI